MEAHVQYWRILVLLTLIKNITQDLYEYKALHIEFPDYKYMKLAHSKQDGEGLQKFWSFEFIMFSQEEIHSSSHLPASLDFIHPSSHPLNIEGVTPSAMLGTGLGEQGAEGLVPHKIYNPEEKTDSKEGLKDVIFVLYA